MARVPGRGRYRCGRRCADARTLRPTADVNAGGALFLGVRRVGTVFLVTRRFAAPPTDAGVRGVLGERAPRDVRARCGVRGVAIRFACKPPSSASAHARAHPMRPHARDRPLHSGSSCLR
eukprot:TRINITY_DN196_c0_g1_i1.p4 TRINITY_DN196_c0_g1~~TRINITY_DN196_c0_g1_i1.p4  ORF type:complete len:120 (+),score=23.51 TRINITY_DN196_c0_g1_i1:656-1015(+)